MKKILMIGINSRYTHTSTALFYLKSSVADLDINPEILEFSSGETAENITSSIVHQRPDILAVSVYIWNAVILKKILETIKDYLPDLKIVLGGPEVSFSSGMWIEQFSAIDYIVTGGGETAFRDLALSGFSRGGGIITGCNPHFSTIRFPYADDDMKRFKGRFIYYESSRGCPFKCSYCLSSVSGGKVEYRTVPQVKEELDFFSSYNLPLVKFIDRTFNLKKEHYLPVWEYIKKKFTGSGTCFHFEIFPELLDEDDLLFLSKVPPGLFQFEMGIQSVKPETLNEINRNGSWVRAERNIKKLVELKNIHLHTDLIAGLPYEGFTDYAESFNSIYSLGAEHMQGGFLKVLPGTEMRGKSAEYGLRYNPLPPYEIIESNWVSSEEMHRLKLVSELVDLMHNSGKFPDTEKFLVSLYSTPFRFFNRLGDFFIRDRGAKHRKWEYMAEILLNMVSIDYPGSVYILLDYLRWDWCCVMKQHRYPELLRSDRTVEAKRRGFRFFNGLMCGDNVDYDGINIKKSDLRCSIFFLPETERFITDKMKNRMAVFLPDKHIVFFNADTIED